MTKKIERDLARQIQEIAIPENMTDAGNALRLVRRHGDQLRFNHAEQRWLVWDGCRWAADRDGEIVRRAKETVRRIYAKAAETDDERERQALSTHAKASESRARIDAMINLARSEHPIAAKAEDFDSDPWLLTVLNGTLDLRSGELLPHRPEDLITKLAPVEYKPGARAKVWDDFVASCVGGDIDLASFLQRAVGYSLTGDTSEESLFFLHGPEATGKTTFLESLKSVLDDYATTADFDAFTKRKGNRGASNDLARLGGARLVAASEVEPGKGLAEGVVKQTTGGDTVTARFLYEEFNEFKPQFKLWLAANNRPEVNAADGAMWRRIVLVPFVNQVAADDRDPEVKRRLVSDPKVQSAILAWAVQGCLDWRSGGLRIPRSVCEYTHGYRRDNDPIQEWLESCCSLDDPSAETKAADLRRSYETWARGGGEDPVSVSVMATHLKAHGCVQQRRRDHRAWRGIRVLASGGDGA